MTSDEAHWNIVGNLIHEIKPPVKRLGFFVPEDKYINVRQGEVPTTDEADRQRRETEFYAFFRRNKLEKEVYDEYKKMLDDEEDVQHIVKTINKKLGYKMLYVDDKGKIQQFFDYEKEEKMEDRKRREEEGTEQRNLPWSFELTYKQFGERYRYDIGPKHWKRYKHLTNTVCRLFLSYPGSDMFYERILLQHRKGMTSVEELYMGPDGKRYGTFKHACVAWEFVNNSDEYFTAVHEANLMGWYGTRLLKFFGSIVAAGDATNIQDIWNGVDPKKEKKMDEEILHNKGMKHLMITVPKTMRDMGCSMKYSELSPSDQRIAEQYTLRELAKYLEKQGKDYPSDLPQLDETQVFELSKEWIQIHRKDSNEAKRIYEENRASKLLIFYMIPVKYVQFQSKS